jgi:hypothetical protein
MKREINLLKTLVSVPPTLVMWQEHIKHLQQPFPIYLSGLVTAVAVFQNPNTIPFCLTTDLLRGLVFGFLAFFVL